MLLPKEDNVQTGKQGLGFENQNDNVNPSVLNKAKELAPCLYNIDEMGKDELSDHKIISEEELKSGAEKHLKVKQRKSPLSYHGFVYEETQFEEPPKVPLKKRNVNLKEHLEQFDFDEIETQNIELEHKVASLIQENEHLKLVYKNLFDSIKKSRVQTQSLNVSQNEVENLQSQLSEFANKKIDKVFQKIESMKKKMFDSRISNDFLQKSLYDSDPSNVKSESGDKKIIFGNETLRFETKIKELEMTLSQQTKDFEDAKVDFSKKTDKFETYFEKLENTRVVLE
ncbi:hypothetical protein Tco_0470934 [Tanacetum coccineum]